MANTNQSRAQSIDSLEEHFTDLRRECLRKNGWQYGMWRWFWVWRKQVHDATFVCMTDDEALRVQVALRGSDDYYPAPAPAPQES